MRRGEVDNGIDVIQAFRGHGGAVRIVLRSNSANVMFSLGGDLRHQRPSLASAEKKEIHTVQESI